MSFNVRQLDVESALPYRSERILAADLDPVCRATLAVLVLALTEHRMKSSNTLSVAHFECESIHLYTVMQA